ncbi:GNAT family N-acetyltransferase [Kangiella sp. HD9-110m-PIT-SAG07]|nr:GNAT family N-acetyltransferase [Kangiella sp. HD9-110m-PIT-SAG07]
MNLGLQPLKDKNYTAASQLNVYQEQVGFVETINTILGYIDKKTHGHIIINKEEPDNEEIVGFFLIDTNYSRIYDFCSNHDLGLRSFFIDKNHQGHGYGKGAVKLLSDYLLNQYATASSVYLTVNCKNPSAKHCYEQGGFIDTGELYFGGDFGPQHIMKLSLNIGLA